MQGSQIESLALSEGCFPLDKCRKVPGVCAVREVGYNMNAEETVFYRSSIEVVLFFSWVGDFVDDYTFPRSRWLIARVVKHELERLMVEWD